MYNSKLIDEDILKKFCSLRYREYRGRRMIHTLDQARSDDDIRDFLISNNVFIEPDKYDYVIFLLGLVKSSLIKQIHDTNSYGIGYAIGFIVGSAAINNNPANRRLNDLYKSKYCPEIDLNKIYSLYAELILTVANNKQKINALYFNDEINLLFNELTEQKHPSELNGAWGIHINLAYSVGYTSGIGKSVSLTPNIVKSTREKFGLTQQQCADLVYVDIRTWQKWELGERKMNRTAFQLFCMKLKFLYPDSPAHKQMFGTCLDYDLTRVKML